MGATISPKLTACTLMNCWIRFFLHSLTPFFSIRNMLTISFWSCFRMVTSITMINISISDRGFLQNKLSTLFDLFRFNSYPEVLLKKILFNTLSNFNNPNSLTNHNNSLINSFSNKTGHDSSVRRESDIKAKTPHLNNRLVSLPYFRVALNYYINV